MIASLLAEKSSLISVEMLLRMEMDPIKSMKFLTNVVSPSVRILESAFIHKNGLILSDFLRGVDCA